jgi:hypothetical protein
MRKASGLGQYQVNVTQMRRRLLTGDWINPYPAQDGDLLMDYNWIQPISIVAAAGAEYAKQESAAERSYMKEGGAKERAGWLAVSMLAGAKSLAEEPLLQGFSSFNQESGPIRAIRHSAVYDTVLGIPSMFVPQLVRQASTDTKTTSIRESRNVDRTASVTADMKQMFMNIGAQLPWVSQELSAALRPYGRSGAAVFLRQQFILKRVPKPSPLQTLQGGSRLPRDGADHGQHGRDRHDAPGISAATRSSSTGSRSNWTTTRSPLTATTRAT